MSSNTVSAAHQKGFHATLRSVTVITVLLAIVTGCAPSTTKLLAPAPNLYAEGAGRQYPADSVPTGFRRTITEILYVTDRRPEIGPDGTLERYTAQRSDSMAFGVSLVEYGELEDWPALLTRTQTANARELTRLDPVFLQEIVRFPATPMPFSEDRGRLQARPDLAATYHAQADAMRREITQRLRKHDLDRVTVFTHGFKNEFEDGLGTLANLWHYTGRQSLPLAYSWPTGDPGLLSYFRDVLSGEFTVFHAKETLRILASIPDVRQIDIVSHSRGSAVMSAALRELLIEARALGRDPRQVMKTGVLIMAAPDIDLGVARQRLVAERFGQAFEQINVYTNPGDQALGLSGLIGRIARLGTLRAQDEEAAEFARLARLGNVSFIMVEGVQSPLGHSYFRENPAVMSDIILTLATREMPGSEFRPLIPEMPNVWRLSPGYPDFLPGNIETVFEGRR